MMIIILSCHQLTDSHSGHFLCIEYKFKILVSYFYLRNLLHCKHESISMNIILPPLVVGRLHHCILSVSVHSELNW